MSLSVALSSERATERLGEAIAAVLVPKDVLLLYGDLGAGKTTFVRGLVHALRASVDVTSPTFTLRHEYETLPPICHVDCWRLRDVAELDALGLDEVLADGGVLVVEWGALAASRFGGDALEVRLRDGLDGSTRVAQLRETSSSWRARIDDVSKALADVGLSAEVDRSGDARS